MMCRACLVCAPCPPSQNCLAYLVTVRVALGVPGLCLSPGWCVIKLVFVNSIKL